MNVANPVLLPRLRGPKGRFQSPEAIAELVAYLNEGNSPDLAAAKFGVHRTTVFRAIRKLNAPTADTSGLATPPETSGNSASNDDTQGAA